MLSLLSPGRLPLHAAFIPLSTIGAASRLSLVREVSNGNVLASAELYNAVPTPMP